MKPRMMSCVALVLALASAFGAGAQDTFKRPDCSAYKTAFKPESKCFREIRKNWQQANFAALQKTGLMFIHMARPDLDSSPAAKEVVEKKVEGSFAIRFSVATDGTVYDVKRSTSQALWRRSPPYGPTRSSSGPSRRSTSPWSTSSIVVSTCTRRNTTRSLRRNCKVDTSSFVHRGTRDPRSG